ncbi:sigma D regulator [Zooshikella sp. RANM57]|uniref:sigma D regulator n=1 Tax=Zooshikella sp. RANM57 TaxID=3425863 RepID=UPI003D6FD087
MLEGCHNAKERWGGVSEIIDRWLNERQELIVLYCDINGLNGNKDKKKHVKYDELQSLCQLMMDYVSAGHFEVYEQLLREGKEFDDGGIEVAKQLYPLIQKTTEVCLHFNDKYDSQASCESMQDKVREDLSQLGQAMEERFTYEDQLIEVLHNAHKELLSE